MAQYEKQYLRHENNCSSNFGERSKVQVDVVYKIFMDFFRILVLVFVIFTNKIWIGQELCTQLQLLSQIIPGTDANILLLCVLETPVSTHTGGLTLAETKEARDPRSPRLQMPPFPLPSPNRKTTPLTKSF